MYESFFGLSERPFAFAPLVERYFPGAAIEAARQSIGRCVGRAEGVAVLVGPAGTGKTLLCQMMAAQFADQVDVAVLASGRICTRRALLQAISFELGLPYRGMEEGDLRLALIDRIAPRQIERQFASNGLLLIVDEAHTLPWRLIEELRQLTNLVRGGQPRVRLVLVGGRQLEELLANPKTEAFNQRIAVRAYLEGLDRAQTADYVRHQIELCGGDSESIFTNDALDAVYQATDGIPRLVNQVCDHALLLALAGGVRQLSGRGIEEAWADLQQLPTPWNAVGGAPAPAESAAVVEFGELDHDLGDELPAAVPFRPATQASTVKADDAALQIASEIEASDEFEPPPESEPEIELVLQPAENPFREAFDDEEVVIDRYTSLEGDTLAHCPRVCSAEGRDLAAMLSSVIAAGKSPPPLGLSAWPGKIPAETKPAIEVKPKAPAPAEASPAVADLIVIEDDPASPQPATKSVRVQRREYSQLFAQLQRR